MGVFVLNPRPAYLASLKNLQSLHRLILFLLIYVNPSRQNRFYLLQILQILDIFQFLEPYNQMVFHINQLNPIEIKNRPRNSSLDHQNPYF